MNDFEQKSIIENEEQKFVQSTAKQRKRKLPAAIPLKAKQQMHIKRQKREAKKSHLQVELNTITSKLEAYTELIKVTKDLKTL